MKQEIDISYAQWKTVVTLGSGDLEKKFAKVSNEQLEQVLALCAEWDPNTKENVFYILEVPFEDGSTYRMPDEVQRLYGKRYLLCLNNILEAARNELTGREFVALMEMFA